MKKNYLLLLIAIFSCTIVFAQVPQAVPYQAVARNNAGNLIANQNISVRLSILNSTAAGPVVFQEKHTVTTNQFGLFTVNLGQGTLLSGTFSGVNWAVNAKYLKVEFDPNGGNSFINMGTSQLLSVPYALFSGNSANLPNGTNAGNTLRWDGTKWIADNALYNDGLKIGLGTIVPGTGPNPSAKLDIRDEDGNNSDISQTVAGSGFPALIWTKQAGTLAAPAATPSNTFLGGLQGVYYNGVDYRTGAAMYYVADTTIGNWHPASIQFRTTAFGNNDNLTRMVIKHNGNVGIGTTLPTSRLHVAGKLRVQDGTEGLNKVFTSDATGVGSWQALPPGNIPNGTALGNTLRWNGTSWIADNAIYSDGSKIGLGTTTPGAGINPTVKIDLQDEDGSNSDISQTVAGPGFPALIWNKQLGTLAAPQAVIKNTFVGGIQGNYYNGTDYNVGAAMYYIADTISANSFPTSIQFRTTSVDSAKNLTRMVIKHNGKVGIGTTIPGVNGYNPYARLDIRDETGENSDINQLVAGGGIPAITWAQQRGTLASPQPIIRGSVFGRLDGNYYTASGYSQGDSRAASIFFRADTLLDSGNPGSIYFATAQYGQTIPVTNLIIKHNGNVGIGTQDPERKLDVRGNVKIVDGTQGAGKILTSDATGNASWQTPAPSGGGGGVAHVAFFAGDEPVADQNIPANNIATLTFGSGYAFFNDGNGYNLATNHFIAPVAGVYQLNATINVTGTPGALVQLFLRNGAGHVIRGEQTIPSGGSTVITLAATVNSTISGNDFWIEGVSPSPLTIKKYQSGFSGHLVYEIPQ